MTRMLQNESRPKKCGVGVRRQIVHWDIRDILPVQNLQHGFLSDTQTMSENRLFVGNLAYQTMENDLQDYFAQAGTVTSVNLMLDKFTGKSRGFAFIEFASADEAQQGSRNVSRQRFPRSRADREHRTPKRRSPSAS